ncbi:hypothetical protein SMC83_003349 [Cronobacter sakazakii]|nr:hypothetical protein [Cronobacter sakazakii]
MEIFNPLQQRLADVGRHGVNVSQNNQIGIKALLLAGHFGAANQPVLFQFSLDRIA